MNLSRSKKAFGWNRKTVLGFLVRGHLALGQGGLQIFRE